PDDATRAETNHAPIVRPIVAPAPRLPAVHPLAAIGVLALDPLGRRWFDQAFLGREELVVRSDHGGAETLRGEIDQILKRRRHINWPVAACSSRSSCHTRTPRTYVSLTRPRSVRPAYGVSLWRCCNFDGSTVHSASGSHTTRSASQPSAMRP